MNEELTEEDVDGMKVKQLQAELRKRVLPVSGNKKVLQNRLKENIRITSVQNLLGHDDANEDEDEEALEDVDTTLADFDDGNEDEEGEEEEAPRNNVRPDFGSESDGDKEEEVAGDISGWLKKANAEEEVDNEEVTRMLDPSTNPNAKDGIATDPYAGLSKLEKLAKKHEVGL